MLFQACAPRVNWASEYLGATEPLHSRSGTGQWPVCGA
jgi:hypothetical protein